MSNIVFLNENNVLDRIEASVAETVALIGEIDTPEHLFSKQKVTFPWPSYAFTNVLVGGDFENTTGWSNTGNSSALIAENNTLKSTGLGTVVYCPQIYQVAEAAAYAPGNTYFLRARVRATGGTVAPDSIQFSVGNVAGLTTVGGNAKTSPVLDTWYDCYARITVGSGGTVGAALSFYAGLRYATAANAVGTIEVQKFVAFDITSSALTDAQIVALLDANMPTSYWFEGSKSLYDLQSTNGKLLGGKDGQLGFYAPNEVIDASALAITDPNSQIAATDVDGAITELATAFSGILASEADRETAEDERKEAETIRSAFYDEFNAQLAENTNQTNSVQTQLDTIVIDGDSSVEAAQARVNGAGVAFDTLKLRLDDGDTRMNDIALQPKLSMQYALSKLLPRNTAAGGYQYTFSCYYQVYDAQFKTSGAIYAVEKISTGATEAKIFRSLDGGDSWTIIGPVPCNYDAGELITAIFVEPYDERIIVQKLLDKNAAIPDYRLITHNASLVVNSTLITGNKYLHAASHSIDSCLGKDGSTRIIMFAEYGNDSVADVKVWRSIDKGISWSTVFQKTANNGVAGSGQIRHFHTIQVDPYTKDWYLGSGDNDNQCFIWRSQDDGVTWDVLFSGTQNERTLGFVFEEDYFYYAMDAASDTYPNKIYKINKTTLERTVVAYPQAKKPVYALTKTFFPKGFLVFSVHEWGYSDNTDNLIVHWYDTENDRLFDVARLSLRGVSTSSNAGISEASRCQCNYSGSIFFKMTDNMAMEKYGDGVTSYVRTGVMRAKLSM